jgi:hypothetical protein
MTIKIHDNVEQGTDEWLAMRLGLLTASEMDRILTPTLKVASNDKERTHLYEILAQRITGYVEPQYVSDKMLRGHADEITAREIYSDKIAPVTEVGFVTNDRWGFTLGCSPDGLVGDEGMIEIKSRDQKYQARTLVELEVPQEYMIQIQTSLLITARKWCDFLSFSGGMPMPVMRVLPDPAYFEAIIGAATGFEERIAIAHAKYLEALDGRVQIFETERTEEKDIII